MIFSVCNFSGHACERTVCDFVPCETLFSGTRTLESRELFDSAAPASGSRLWFNVSSWTQGTSHPKLSLDCLHSCTSRPPLQTQQRTPTFPQSTESVSSSEREAFRVAHNLQPTETKPSFGTALLHKQIQTYLCAGHCYIYLP